MEAQNPATTVLPIYPQPASGQEDLFSRPWEWNLPRVGGRAQGFGEKKHPFHCESLGRDKGLPRYLACPASAPSQPWDNSGAILKGPLIIYFLPLLPLAEGATERKKRLKKKKKKRAYFNRPYLIAHSRWVSLTPPLSQPSLHFLFLPCSLSNAEGPGFVVWASRNTAERGGWRSGDRVNKGGLTLRIMTGPAALSGRTPKLPGTRMSFRLVLIQSHCPGLF